MRGYCKHQQQESVYPSKVQQQTNKNTNEWRLEFNCIRFTLHWFKQDVPNKLATECMHVHNRNHQIHKWAGIQGFTLTQQCNGLISLKGAASAYPVSKHCFLTRERFNVLAFYWHYLDNMFVVIERWKINILTLQVTDVCLSNMCQTFWTETTVHHCFYKIVVILRNRRLCSCDR